MSKKTPGDELVDAYFNLGVISLVIIFVVLVYASIKTILPDFNLFCN